MQQVGAGDRTMVDIFPYQHILSAMARLATTHDVFNALAEPARRRIVELLAGHDRAVGEIAEALKATHSQVSKHLRVLGEVRLVRCQKLGRSRVYHLEPDALLPLHAWVSQFDALWDRQIRSIKARAEARAARGEA